LQFLFFSLAKMVLNGSTCCPPATIPEQHEEQVEGLHLAHVFLLRIVRIKGEVGRVVAVALLRVFRGDHTTAQSNIPGLVNIRYGETCHRSNIHSSVTSVIGTSCHHPVQHP
jgi:hypothetical protein